MSGCSNTEAQRMHAAAETAGEARAAYALPPWPAECARPMERVTPKAGEKARWTQKRWEIVADATDQRIGDCATFYGDLRSRLAN
ncbi:hypothetical protein [Ferirhizobium litorale]|uniref:hypothetical protein n=1 Tax=Ferirhizobium litorale TaxID=2927786 RepID=UPI003530489A